MERRLTDLGFLLFDAARWSEAETAFRAAAIADPDDEDAWLGLGSSLRQQERSEDAAVVFGMAAALARSSGAWATLLAADALLECGAGGKAREALAWFDDIARRTEVSEEQAGLARTLRSRLEAWS